MGRKILYLQCGLGNQMFQFAYFRYLQSRGYADLAIDMSAPSLHLHNAQTVRSVFANINNSNIRFVPYAKGRLLHLWSDVLKKEFGRNTETEAPLGVIEYGKRWLRGYWQMAWPAEECREQLVHDFIFPPLMDEKNVQLAQRIASTSSSVSLHIRRGDYVSNFDVFGSCSTMEYYRQAIQYIEHRVHDAHYFIFSDDVSWVRENFPLERCTIVEHNTGEHSYRDMQLMSMAAHAIVANSSFSWWGAWLADRRDERIVVAPKRWFGDASDEFNERITPSDWVRI